MKTKKTGIAVLTAALLVLAVLMAGCISPAEEISVKQEAEENYQIPAGKGVVRFKISGEGARTILPTPTPPGNMYYQVVFTARSDSSNLYFPSAAGNGAAPAATKLAYGAINTAPLALPPDTYDISITAFNNAAGAIPLAGWNNPTTSPYTITDGETISVIANLKGIVNGTDTGTFSYDITIPTAAYIVSFIATNYSTTVETPITLNAGVNTSTQALNSGYYIVQLTLSQQYYQTKQYTYALHIYPTMTSTMPAIAAGILPAALVKNVFDVDFDLDGEPISNGPLVVQHIPYATFVPATITKPIPSNTGSAFGKWYKDALRNQEWVFATERVLSDTTLYASFVPAAQPGKATFTITFTINEVADTVSANVSIIHRGNFDGDETITITLAPPIGGGTWTNIIWRVDGMTNAIVAGHVSAGALIINNSADFYPVLAGSSFDVYVVADKGGELYSPDIPVTITVQD